MTWNHRIIRHHYFYSFSEDAPFPPSRQFWFGIHEVFYKEDGSLMHYSSDPDGAQGESMEELKESYEQMAEAFNFPILDECEFPAKPRCEVLQ